MSVYRKKRRSTNEYLEGFNFSKDDDELQPERKNSRSLGELTEDDVVNFLTNANENYQITQLSQFTNKSQKEDKNLFLMPLYYFVKQYVQDNKEKIFFTLDDKGQEIKKFSIVSKLLPDTYVEITYKQNHMKLITKRNKKKYGGEVSFNLEWYDRIFSNACWNF